MPDPTAVARRILVIDDDWINRELLESILNAAGFDVLLAANGTQGLAVAADQQPDLVMLDVRMPDLDGYTVCRRLKAEPATRAIPVVMITGLEDDMERDNALDAGAVDIVNRFLPMNALVERLNTHLRR